MTAQLADDDLGQPVYMAEIERVLERNRSTIRVWEGWASFPAELAFHRDERGWRYWTREQLERAKEWVDGMNPGRSQPRRNMAAS